MVAPEKTPVPATDEVEWETLPMGIGTVHDPETDGALDGEYLGSSTMEVPDKNSEIPNATRETHYHQFHPHGAEAGEIVSIWGSANLDPYFIGDGTLIRVGDRVRISFAGRSQFTGKTGRPQTVKNYKVQAAKITQRV